MHRTYLLLPLAAAWTGCGSDPEPTEVPPPVCDDLATEEVGNVPYNAWPDGSSTAHATMNTMAARYLVSDSCKPGGQTVVKVTGEIPWESLPLVTSPYSEAGCGCAQDAAFSADSDYDHVAQYEGATVFIEDGSDPGAENITVFTETALFGGDAPFLVRSCGGLALEPYRGSTYTQLDVVFRIDAGGVRSGTYTLSNDEETVDCELTAWTVEAEV